METCAYCGKELKNADWRRKYCSDACRYQAKKIRDRNRMRNQNTYIVIKCSICGKVFKISESNRAKKYCSKECATTAARKRLVKSSKNEGDRISKKNEEARMMGLSYGQYQAQKYLQDIEKGESK